MRTRKGIEMCVGGVAASCCDGRQRRKFSMGDKVSCRGKEEDLNDLMIEDFDYGRYLRSKGEIGRASCRERVSSPV